MTVGSLIFAVSSQFTTRTRQLALFARLREDEQSPRVTRHQHSAPMDPYSHRINYYYYYYYYYHLSSFSSSSSILTLSAGADIRFRRPTDASRTAPHKRNMHYILHHHIRYHTLECAATHMSLYRPGSVVDRESVSTGYISVPHQHVLPNDAIRMSQHCRPKTLDTVSMRIEWGIYRFQCTASSRGESSQVRSQSNQVNQGRRKPGHSATNPPRTPSPGKREQSVNSR